MSDPADTAIAPAAGDLPLLSALRRVVGLAVTVALGLAIGAVVGLVVGIGTGLIPFAC